jgi:type II secretory pathway component GspD/PulD (secretin)
MANQFGQSNSIDYLNTGLIVQVQPQVTGGVVSTKLAIEESRVGRAEDGIPIIVPAKGESVRAAPVHSRTLQTAVNVPSGQTIVLSGMTENDGPRKRQLAVLLCPRIIPANSGESARPKQ